jgi:hypothetical protein
MLESAMLADKIINHICSQSIPLKRALKLTNKRFSFQNFATGYTPLDPRAWWKETTPLAPTASIALPCAGHFALAALQTQI